MMDMRSLVWFRADLRTRDNPALHHACAESGGGVIGAFIICPQQWREHDWADVRVEFILRTLRELSGKLGKLNIPLLIRTAPRFKDVPATLLDLARAHQCDALCFNV